MKSHWFRGVAVGDGCARRVIGRILARGVSALTVVVLGHL
jgi:hypothetical protein